jgi:hypothetical protein
MTFRPLVVLVALTLTGAAHAQISFSLMPSTLVAVPGETVTFTGTISNASTTDTIFLNGLQIGASTSANLSVDLGSFLNYVPVSLAPGGSYSGNLFDVLLSLTAPPGTYSGAARLVGGTTDTAQNALTPFESFFVASVVPEPSALVLLALGGLIGVLLQRR